MKNDRERLSDIQEAIARIEKHAQKGRSAFENEELLQTWVVHHLQIIGEASRGLTSEFRACHPEIPWSKIVGMRNILVHDYFGIDVEIVWSVVEKELPILQGQIEAISKELQKNS